MRLPIILAILAAVVIGTAILFQWLEQGRGDYRHRDYDTGPRLVSCAACSAKISARALACPKCGHPR